MGMHFGYNGCAPDLSADSGETLLSQLPRFQAGPQVSFEVSSRPPHGTVIWGFPSASHLDSIRIEEGSGWLAALPARHGALLVEGPGPQLPGSAPNGQDPTRRSVPCGHGRFPMRRQRWTGLALLGAASWGRGSPRCARRLGLTWSSSSATRMPWLPGEPASSVPSRGRSPRGSSLRRTRMRRGRISPSPKPSTRSATANWSSRRWPRTRRPSSRSSGSSTRS